MTSASLFEVSREELIDESLPGVAETLGLQKFRDRTTSPNPLADLINTLLDKREKPGYDRDREDKITDCAWKINAEMNPSGPFPTPGTWEHSKMRTEIVKLVGQSMIGTLYPEQGRQQ